MSMTFLPLAVSGMEMGLYFGLAGLLSAIIFAGLGMYFHHRRQALWHETARIALEKGQPLPVLPDRRATRPERAHQHNDFRSGLIMIAIGAGLYLFFLPFFGGLLSYIGAIPGFIGVALLLYATLSALFGRKDQSSSPRPPQT
jgi:hypothetical protein